jgi:tRNA(fMet)-specific endonuclease VapC
VTRYLLDTCIVSDLVRRPQGVVAGHIERVGEASIATSVIVAAELRFGAAKKGSQRLSDRIDAILKTIEILTFEPPADATYGVIRANLEKAGRMIGANDLLIAAHALALGHTLVTDNERDFQPVRGLSIVNWLRGGT